MAVPGLVVGVVLDGAVLGVAADQDHVPVLAVALVIGGVEEHHVSRGHLPLVLGPEVLAVGGFELGHGDELPGGQIVIEAPAAGIDLGVLGEPAADLVRGLAEGDAAGLDAAAHEGGAQALSVVPMLLGVGDGLVRVVGLVSPVGIGVNGGHEGTEQHQQRQGHHHDLLEHLHITYPPFCH